jgi:hypothetical protein
MVRALLGRHDQVHRIEHDESRRRAVTVTDSVVLTVALAAVIVVVPTLIAVTRPLLTVATVGSELAQRTTAPLTGRPSRVVTAAERVAVVPETRDNGVGGEIAIAAGVLSGGAAGPEPPQLAASTRRTIRRKGGDWRRMKFGAGRDTDLLHDASLYIP